VGVHSRFSEGSTVSIVTVRAVTLPPMNSKELFAFDEGERFLISWVSCER